MLDNSQIDEPPSGQDWEDWDECEPTQSPENPSPNSPSAESDEDNIDDWSDGEDNFDGFECESESLSTQPVESESDEADESESAQTVLRVTPGRMAVILDNTPVPDDLTPLIERIRVELLERGVPAEYLDEQLEQRLRMGAQDKEMFEDVVVLEGTPPTPPSNGYIEWGADFFNTAFVVDEETGAVNYRKRQAQVSVETGQLLATIIPPKPGQNGHDVFGKVVRPDRGQWPPFRVGQNVREERDTNSYYATTSGRIRWCSCTLSVDPVLVIEGNVDLKTGDIEHPGAVIIKGDIEQGATVRADGDIEVYGMIETATVRTGGDLLVHGGIAGHSDHPLVVAGKVHAKFLNEVQIEAGHDVIIEREILQSSVKTQGAISMPAGRLVGGETVALRGLYVGKTGSEASVPTVIIVGKDFRLHDRLLKMKEKVDLIQEKRQELRDQAAPLLGKGSRITAAERGTLLALREMADELDNRIRGITAAMDRMKAQAKAAAQLRVEVNKRFHPDTIIDMWDLVLHVKDAFPGPAHAVRSSESVELKRGRH